MRHAGSQSLRAGDAPQAFEPRFEKPIGLGFDPARDLLASRAAVRRVVLEPAIARRIVRRRAALPGIAFQLALEAVSPLLGGLTKWAKGLETWINNARINSCETAKAIVSTAAEAEAAGYSSQEACGNLAIEMGLETDRDAARRRCATDRTSILASARTSGELANQVRQRAQAMLLQLSQEKGLLYQKVGSFRAVSSHLEELERQLRSSMPQHVMDMLGQQAAHLSR